MNSLAWTGIIVWGIVITFFGLLSAGAPSAHPEMRAHDVVFLVTGGLLTVMIGTIGLMGFMGWIPGLRKEQKTAA